MEVNSSPSLASPDVFLPILTSAPSRKSSDKCLGLMLNPGTWREGHWEQENSAGSVQRYVNVPLFCSSSATGRHQHTEVHLHLTEREVEVQAQRWERLGWEAGPAQGAGTSPGDVQPRRACTLASRRQLLPSSARIQSRSIQQHRFLELERAADYF